MRSTFASFYVAKGGMDAARANLSITGQNMTNSGVSGYTRQRVDLYSVGSSGIGMRYADTSPHIGGGVSIGGTSQLRDPYLDVRYRRENTKFGQTSVEAATLNDIKYVLDEISKDGMDEQFNDLKKQLQNLITNNGDQVSEGILKTSASMLLKMFNSASTKLNEVKKQELDYLKNTVTRTNDLLSGIADLNQQIKEANIAGNPALELNDSRNMMIDELSSYIPIETSVKLVDIGSGTMIEELTVSMSTTEGDKFALVEHDKAKKYDLLRDADKNVIEPVKVQLIGYDGIPVGGSDKGMITTINGIVSDKIFSGGIAGHLKMLNSKGEYDMPAGTKQRGIQYYSNMIDSMVNKFANEFNKANSTNDGPNWDKPMFEAGNARPKINMGGNLTLDGFTVNVSSGGVPNSVNGNVITLNLPPDATNADLQKALQDLVTANNGAGAAFDGVTAADIANISVDGEPENGTSFGENLSKPKITASNISISTKWENTTGSYITRQKDTLNTGGKDDANNNYLFMINLLSTDMNYTADGSNVPLFKGSFQSMFHHTSTTLGMESANVKRIDNSYASTLNDIQSQRASVSSVNIDEEGVNLIQYQHSLTAASRFMTTLDEAVDNIINRMGIVGR